MITGCRKRSDNKRNASSGVSIVNALSTTARVWSLESSTLNRWIE
jgi:hypothetical protein